MTAAMELRGVSKSYGGDRTTDTTNVLDGVDLEIADGEFIAILGFSGSGKTTLVSIMAGLVEPDSGQVFVDGTPTTGTDTDRGLVFQNYSLMPWLTVEGNVRLAVDAVHESKSNKERQAIATEMIDLVGLSHASDRKLAQLSGAMRQRVAVARTLATQPKILLLDEPLSALDALTSATLQDEIERIRAQERRTIVLITNDVDEALLLADRVAVLDKGPGASIGRIFDVDLPRPRDRTALNNDLAFKLLRNEVVAYLDELNVPASAGDGDGASHTDSPLDRLGPPRAYTKAAKTRLSKRYLEFANLTKVYPTPNGPLTVIEDVDIVMDRGEFISLIGHSGCGKSTALTMAAGLNEITGGWIALDGHEVTTAGPDKAVVFQAPSLLPWLTAKENVSIGVSRVYPDATRQERNEVVEYYLDRVGLADAMHRKAHELSNGMKQRVGLARAFALSPKLLLLDEPFGMLDSLTRWDLQDVLVEVWNRTKVTAICVTHDVDEAILLADRVVMMTNGPNARIGKVLDVDLPRPRDRKELLEDPLFYSYREEILDFLDDYKHGADSDAA